MNNTIRSANIYCYSGYRHNRYDGYSCSWGVLMALGASPTADCFANATDGPDGEFDIAFNGNGPDIQTGENTGFRQSVLQNLDLTDSDISDIKNMDDGEKYEHSEFWSEYEFKIVFERKGENIFVNFDNAETFICKF